MALLGCLIGGRLGKAEVLIQNQNTAGQSTFAANSRGRFTVTFNGASSTPVSLGALAFFSSGATSDTNLDVVLKRGGTTLATDSNLTANGSVNTLGGGYAYMTYFNFINIAAVSISNTGPYTLEIGANGANSINGAYYYTSAGTPLTVSSSLTGVSQSTTSYNGGGPANAYVNFTILNTAIAPVPEPGTFLLGGLAASSVGAGVWWKRRKKKAAEQSEAPEGTPAV